MLSAEHIRPHSRLGITPALGRNVPFLGVSIESKACRSNRTCSGRPTCAHASANQTHHTASTRKSWQLNATRQTKQESEQAKPDANIVSQSAGYVSNLVNDLLYGAASRMERGQTTCISCKGSGTRVCSGCKGQGILAPQQLRKAKDPVRQAAHKVQSILGGGNDYSTQAARSNRCPKCHGSGQLMCTSCEGHGFRGDAYE